MMMRSATALATAQAAEALLVAGLGLALARHPGRATYALALAGMLGMTMTAAREWGRYNIRTNSI